MATQYENAPITEALVDIKIEALPPSSLPALEAIHASIEAEYPQKREVLLVEGRFSIGENMAMRQGRMGFDFRTKDGRQVLQARLDGFTFSRLKPYVNWPGLRNEARRLWSIYQAATGSQRVTRVAVRYINQIDIPSAAISYKDYFRTCPEVSPGLPPLMSGFLMQLRMPQPDISGLLILTQATVAAPAPDTTSVILDLDAIKEAPEFSSDDQLWDMLEVLREKKNQYFEGCLTDTARALFGERRTY